VEELALEAVAVRSAVLRVAADRMSDRLEVHADLVGAPGLQAHPQERRRRSASSSSKWVRAARGRSVSIDMRVRARRSRPSGASIVPLRAAGDPRQAQGTRARSGAPPAPISAAGGPPRSWRPRAARRCPCRAGGRCPGARARRRRRRDARALRRACRRGAVRRDARRPPPACRRRAGRRPRRRRTSSASATTESGCAISTAARRSSHRPAGDRSCARHTVERDRPRLDPPLRLRARADVRGEELVEALAGGLRRDVQRLHHDSRPRPGPERRA
jgi:hypothetical protein